MLRLLERDRIPVVGDRTLYVHRMSGPIITVKYHQEDTVNDVCELIRQQIPEFSSPSYYYYRWNPKHVKLVKETNGSYSTPFLRRDRISDHVEDGDTVYMVYDLQHDK